MRTALFTPCYLDGNDDRGNERLERNIKYLRYYRDLRDDLGFRRIFFSDNASPDRLKAELRAQGPSTARFIDFKDHLTRGPGPLDYPYCWRALYSIGVLIAMGYQKIIVCDSDGFILSPRLAHYIKDLESGWTTFVCQKYQFPEASLQVLCEDAFPIFQEYTAKPWQWRVGELMERSIPFTHVEESFNCSRFGEARVPFHKSIDWYGQCPNDITPAFGRASQS